MNIFDLSEQLSISIFTGLAVGMLAVGIGFLFAFTVFPQNDNSQIITAYTDGVLQKNNQIYDFSFQFKTIDSFVERNPVMVDVNALLPGVTSECVKIRFAGAANYSAMFHGTYVAIPQSDTLLSACRQHVTNEIVLFKQRDSYQNNQTLTIQYGMNGDWGVWYFNPEENKPYGDYVPNVIHISPADTLVQLHTNKLQNHFNFYILSLTFVVAGATILQLLIGLKRKKTKPQSQDHNAEKCAISYNPRKKSEQEYISVEPIIDTTTIQESIKSNKIIVKNGITYYPDGKRVDSHGTIL